MMEYVVLGFMFAPVVWLLFGLMHQCKHPDQYNMYGEYIGPKK